jgi:magnesium-transporting ATPase (P-type)
VAKGAACVVLTEPGLKNIFAFVEQGRTIYQRILTWIINKIIKHLSTAELAQDFLWSTLRCLPERGQIRLLLIAF